MEPKQTQTEGFIKHLVKQMQEQIPCFQCIRKFSKYAGIDEKIIIEKILKSDNSYDSTLNIKANSKTSEKLDIYSIPEEAYEKSQQEIFINFVSHKLFEGEKQILIPQKQPWSLLEFGIRTKTVHYLDGFFLFDWNAEAANPKRQFAIIIAKTNNLIPFIEFQHESRRADTWELTGLKNYQFKCNIIHAENLLQEALSERKNGKDWHSVIDKIVQAFKLDPKYLNLAFCIAEIITNAPKVVFPSEMLQEAYKLLQGEQEKYQKGIYSIENCQTLANADIKDYLQNCHAKLDKIHQCLAQLSQYFKNNNNKNIGVNQTNDILLQVEKIRSSCKNTAEVFNNREFQNLFSQTEIQNACNVTTERLLKYTKGSDYTHDYFKEEFKQHFAQLLFDKINPVKINNFASLAAYSYKTILPELRDTIFNEKYGMSYKTYMAILQKRRVAEQFYHSSDHRPTDQEIAKAMKVSLDRLYEIKVAEEFLSHFSFDDEMDSSADNKEDGDFS